MNDTGDHLTGQPSTGPIKLHGSNEALDVYFASTADSATITQNPANGGLNQSFTFDRLSDGTYRIIAGHSGKVFDVAWASTSDGAAIQQFTWNGGQNQRFRVEAVGDSSYFRIVNVLSGLAVTVMGDGSSIVQSAWNDGANQHFDLNIPSGTFIRRPVESGCGVGKVNFASLCYDVPPGYAMTSPGFMGKVCPADWRDDGINCWPPWTGKAIDGLADPNGGDTMRWPVSITSCSSYDQVNGQSCPANWSRSAVCSCVPNPKGKDIKSIIGSVPSSY